VRHRRLADPAQRERCERDAQLGGAQVVLEVLEREQRALGAHVSGTGARLERGRPHLDQRELGGDEEAVGQDQQRRRDQR
jgi:hypothetical protein